MLLSYSTFAFSNDISTIFSGTNSSSSRAKANTDSVLNASRKALVSIQERRQRMFDEAQRRAEANRAARQREYENGSRPALERAAWADTQDEYGWALGYTCKGTYFSVSYFKKVSWQPESMFVSGLNGCLLSKGYNERSEQLAQRACACFTASN